MSDTSLRDQLGDANDDDSTILAICLAERLIANGSADGWVFEVYARNLIGIGRYEDARSALDQAEQLGSERRLPWIIHRRALIEQRRGNFEKAIELWKIAHSHKPDEATFPIYAGTIAFRLGRLSEAEDFARVGTACDKGFPDEAWYNLGGYLAAQQRYDESLVCYEKAIEIDPDYKLALRRRDELLKAFPPPTQGEQDADDQLPARAESEISNEHSNLNPEVGARCRQAVTSLGRSGRN